MKLPLIYTLLPVILGFTCVLTSLVLYNVCAFDAAVFTAGNYEFFVYFVPALFVLALFYQHFFLQRHWQKYDEGHRFWGLTLVSFILWVSIASGMIFGQIFREESLGLREALKVSATGFLAFFIYYWVNYLSWKFAINIESNWKSSRI